MRCLFPVVWLVLFVCLTALSLPFGSVIGFAQEDDLLDGFGDDFDDFSDSLPVEEPAPPGDEPGTPAWSLPFDAGGRLSLMATYNTAHRKPDPGKPDWRGLSALRSELRLEFEDKVFDSLRWYVGVRASHDFVYGLRHSDTYTTDLVDDREGVMQLDKAYVGGRINRYVDLYFGRQIVVWGKSDTLRVVDVINPLDMREPGLTDIEDLRLPLTMTRMDVFLGRWTLKAMAIHEARFDSLPVWGSDYYPSALPLPREHRPGSDVGNTQYAVSMGRTFNGGDLTVYYADLFNRDVHLETLSADSPPQYLLSLDHSRVTMLGFDCNRALGNLMLKTELAVFKDVAYINPPRNDGGILVRGACPGYTRYDGLIGFEYLGFKDAMISFDAVIRYIDDFDSLLATSPLDPKEKEEQWVLRLSRDFWHETLALELLVLGYGWRAEGGAFERVKLSYDLNDHLTVTGGFIMYQNGDAIPVKDIVDNDRLFLEAVYSF